MSSNIAYLGDPHGGIPTHDVATEGGRTLRQEEFRRVMLSAVLSAADAGCNTLIVLGDTAHSKRPPAWWYMGMAEMLQSAHNNDIEVIVIKGNHDRSETSAVDPMDAFNRGTVISTPRVRLVQSIPHLFIPHFGRAYVAAKYPELTSSQHKQMMGAALEAIVNEAKAEYGDRLVVVPHFTIAGASYNSGTQPQLGDSSEFMAPANLFNGVKMVVAGHIHKQQQLLIGNTPIIYPGSAIRTDFGDEGEPKQMLVVDHDNDQTSWHDLPALEFLTVDVEMIGGVMALVSSPEPAGRVIRIKGEVDQTPAVIASIHRLTEHLVEQKPALIAKPTLKFRRTDIVVNTQMTTETNPLDALKEFCDMSGGKFEDNKPALVEAHRELVKAYE
jgi:DNA repair exonuclease SbcCD nuclease subunit